MVVHYHDLRISFYATLAIGDKDIRVIEFDHMLAIHPLVLGLRLHCLCFANLPSQLLHIVDDLISRQERILR
jgi:hypothetical protein